MLSHFKPYALLAFLGVLFFGELVVHPSQVLYSDHSDLLAMHLPMKCFLVRSWQATGEIPLWNPYSFGGMPFIHDIQVAAFYPPHFFLYFLPEAFVGAGMSWLVVVHVILAGWLMFAYAKYRGLGQTGAGIAAIGYMFAGKWLLHLLAGGHYIMTPLAWLPLVLLLLEQAIERHSLARATWAGAVYALIVLGTHPQMTLYAGVFIALWTLGSVFNWPKPEALEQSLPGYGFCSRAPLLWWLGLGAWTVLIAAALSAVQILPALEASGEATRSGGVSAHDIVAVCVPSVLGMIGPGWAESWEDRGGFGILWISAAVAALMLGRGRVRFEGIVCLLLLAFSIGGAALLQWLPGFRLFQIPVRMLMLLALPVALMAGRTTQAIFGTEQTSRNARSRLRRLLIQALFLGLVLGVTSAVSNYLAWRESEPSKASGFFPEKLQDSLLRWAEAVPWSSWIYWAISISMVLIAVWLLNFRWSLPQVGRRWAWGGLLLGELWALVMPHVAVRPEEALYAPSQSVRFLVGEQGLKPNERWRVLDRGLPGLPSSSPLGPALPMLGEAGIEPVLGYNSFDVRRYKEYLQLIMDRDEPVRPRSEPFGFPIVNAFPIHNKPFLDLLGARYLLQADEKNLGMSAEREPPQWWHGVYTESRPAVYSFLEGGIRQLPAFTVYENIGVFPRSFIVHNARPLEDRPGVLKQMKQTDFRKEVLLEEISPQSITSVEATREFEPVTIISYLPNRVVLQANPAAAGFLVLSDVWFPGWKCTVDGQHAPIYRANFLFRAIAIPEGDHHVVFDFDPESYRWGRWVSIAALACVGALSLGWLAFHWEKRGRFGPRKSLSDC